MAGNYDFRAIIRVLGLSVAVGLALGAWRIESNYTVGTDTPSDLVAVNRKMLQNDCVSPYRWADLAEALADNHAQEARQCMDRAVQLGEHIPPILIRAANLALVQGRVEDLLVVSKQVLELVPDYDDVVFGYLDRVSEPSRVLAVLADRKRPMRAWMTHLLSTGNTSGARLAWTQIAKSGWSDAEFTSSYISYLMREKDWGNALHTWSAWLGDRRGDYPDRNLLFNGKFAQKPTGSPLDWRIEKGSDLVETAVEDNALRIHFLGKENVAYAGVTQSVILPRAGTYRLSANVKTQEITTNEGIRLEIKDLGTSLPLNETHEWTPISIDFSVRQAQSAQIQVTRHRSEKFDSKIAGTVWFKDFRLTSGSGAQGERGDKQ